MRSLLTWTVLLLIVGIADAQPRATFKCANTQIEWVRFTRDGKTIAVPHQELRGDMIAVVHFLDVTTGELRRKHDRADDANLYK